jgi:hypothetical protein
VAPDGRHVAEDAHAEDDHHAGRQLPADPELVAQVDDQGGDQHVRDERDDELLVVEDSVELGPHAAEDRVQCRHDGDRQVGLEPDRHRGADDQPDHDADDKSDYRDHQRPPVGLVLGLGLSGGLGAPVVVPVLNGDAPPPAERA